MQTLGEYNSQLSKDEIPIKVLTYLAIISPTLVVFITDTMEGVIKYNLHRDMRQLWYDQSAMQVKDEMGYTNLLNY